MYLGIDLSINGTGLCILDNDGKIFFTVNLNSIYTKQVKKSHRTVRIACTAEYIADLIKQHSICFIAKEGYSFGSMRFRGSSSITPLAELNGVVEHYLLKNDFTEANNNYLIVQPTKVKKFTLSKGNFKKDTAYLLNIYEKTKIRFNTDDEADSYMVANLLFHLIRTKKDISHIKELYDYQIECILDEDKLKSKKLGLKKWLKLQDSEKGFYLL